METIHNLGRLLVRLSVEIKQLDNDYTELNGCFTKEAERINRLDRIDRRRIRGCVEVGY